MSARRDIKSATARHPMPFGAEVNGGRVDFRLWAPAQTQVSLALDGAVEPLPMQADARGMFSTSVEGIGDGARYRFILADGQLIPDPASRFQPDGVHGVSEVIDPASFPWKNADWAGRLWHEAVIYEAHVGCFSLEGTYDGMQRKLDHLAQTGITALELMPVSSFEGSRNWGYDGVLPFAPDNSYGRPEDLKRLIDEAHGRGLMVLLDVVYNHFGPSGNYLSLYAPEFFTGRYRTPWGGAINFEDTRSHVRDFFVHNALYWLNEYRFDGLRLDAVHAIFDQGQPNILEEIAGAVRREIPDRHIHLILENDDNTASYLDPRRAAFYDGQWNDDYHHAAHVITVGEQHAHFADYAALPVAAFAACLARGYLYNGIPSGFRHGAVRGEDTGRLPATAFINFLQNHDQVGNRNDGRRLSSLIDAAPLRALTAITLLAPAIPMLFMGEEWASDGRFYFFCDFHDELAAAVREGRSRDFERQNAAGVHSVDPIPADPNAVETFMRSKLDWHEVSQEAHGAFLQFVRDVLAVRHRSIVPHLKDMPTGTARFQVADDRAFLVRSPLAAGVWLTIAANLSPLPIANLGWHAQGEELFMPNRPIQERIDALAPWDVHVRLAKPTS